MPFMVFLKITVMINSHTLPTFIIGGSPRSGTTFLCTVLDKHPDIFMAKPFSPEPKVCLPTYSSPTDYYEHYNRLFSDVGHAKALGEKTSAYLENEEACLRLRMLFKEIRFLFIVREPVQRAYSNYVRSYSNGLETLPFSEAVKAEGQRKDPFSPNRSYVRPFDYLSRGDYATFAERYFTAFGREHVKFVLFEDILLSPDRFYYEVQEFVQVEPLARAMIEVDQINANNRHDLPLDTILEQELREIMKPKVERFAQITGLDVGAWRY